MYYQWKPSPRSVSESSWSCSVLSFNVFVVSTGGSCSVLSFNVLVVSTGAEVAQYTAAHLPDFIKNLPLYTDGKLADALQEAFLAFDETLTEDIVIQELKVLAGVDDDENEEVEGMFYTLLWFCNYQRFAHIVELIERRRR